MKKTQSLFVLLIGSLLLFSCSKKDTTLAVNANNGSSNTTGNNNNGSGNNTGNTGHSPYFLKLTINDSAYTYYSDSVISYSYNTNSIFGTLLTSQASLYPSVTLMFSRPSIYDTITENQVLALSGRTDHFSDTDIAPTIEYAPSSSVEWASQNYQVDTNYSVKVTSMTFLKNDTYQGYPVRLYVCAGTFKALVMTDPQHMTDMTGSFNMIVSRLVYN